MQIYIHPVLVFIIERDHVCVCVLWDVKEWFIVKTWQSITVLNICVNGISVSIYCFWSVV